MFAVGLDRLEVQVDTGGNRLHQTLLSSAGDAPRFQFTRQISRSSAQGSKHFQNFTRACSYSLEWFICSSIRLEPWRKKSFSALESMHEGGMDALSFSTCVGSKPATRGGLNGSRSKFLRNSNRRPISRKSPKPSSVLTKV